MEYKVKQQPKVVYDAITYQFTLTDESGKELLIRKWEDTKGGGYYILEDDRWVEFYPDEDLEDFILNDLDY